jgi:hypothetical protein
MAKGIRATQLAFTASTLWTCFGKTLFPEDTKLSPFIFDWECKNPSPEITNTKSRIKERFMVFLF